MLQQHEREQPRHLRLVGHQGGEDAGKVDRLDAQSVAYQIGAGARRVALVEQEVQHTEHRRGALGQHVGGWHAVRDARVADLVLGAYETLRHRGLGHEERARDLRRGEPDERAQCQCDLRLGRQCGVTAGEDEAQPVVFDATVVGDPRLTRWSQHRDLLQLRGARRGAAQPVDRAIPGRGREPRARHARDAVARPSLERAREGFLRALLGDVPVARDPDQRRDDATPLLAEGVGDRGLDRGHISQIGLTSIVPMRAPGIFDATSIASSRSLQSTR